MESFPTTYSIGDVVLTRPEAGSKHLLDEKGQKVLAHEGLKNSLIYVVKMPR